MSFRHEQKYLLHQSDYHVLRIRISGLLKKDAHTGECGFYTVRSLYFDDYYNTAFNDKDVSILDRQKYRIRIYNYSDKVIHLERKIKHNNYIAKEIAPLSKVGVQRIEKGDYEFLRDSPHPLLRVFYHEIMSNLLRPRIMIDYEREPYLLEAGTVRITFDRNIRAGIDRLDLFHTDAAMMETLESGFLVMEVKFTEFLPRMVRELLTVEAADYSAISKYMLGCYPTQFKRQTDF